MPLSRVLIEELLVEEREDFRHPVRLLLLLRLNFRQLRIGDDLLSRGTTFAREGGPDGGSIAHESAGAVCHPRWKALAPGQPPLRHDGRPSMSRADGMLALNGPLGKPAGADFTACGLGSGTAAQHAARTHTKIYRLQHRLVFQLTTLTTRCMRVGDSEKTEAFPWRPVVRSAWRGGHL